MLVESAFGQDQVLIVGIGLIGGSIGLRLHSRGADVLVRDVSPGASILAEELGVGRAPREGEHIDPVLVIVATPPDVAGRSVADALEEFPRATVVDVASVKESVAKEVFSLTSLRGIDPSRYVGTHPMAGREVSGVIAARGDLFLSRPFVVVPTPVSREESVRIAWQLGTDLGSTVFEFDAETHDQAVAYVSHVPQIVSSLLASRLTAAKDEALSLAGQGLRDTTRIAASDPRLWVEILSANAPAIGPIIQALQYDVEEVAHAFDALNVENPTPGSRAILAKTMSAGNDGVARIPGKHGTGKDAFFRITVLVPDQPGELARLLTDMGSHAINLEDLRLEHSLGQKVGLAHVSVARSAEQAMLDMLDSRGWARAGQE